MPSATSSTWIVKGEFIIIVVVVVVVVVVVCSSISLREGKA
jgi:hypothetical protein